MKNLSLYSILLATMSSFSSYAMHEYFSSIPLEPIERELVKQAIQSNGLATIKNIINDSKNHQSIAGLTMECRFNKDEVDTDVLTKHIFDEIEKIESKPENKRNLPTKRNHFSFRSWYHRDRHNLDVVYVTMQSCNIKELNEICDSYTE